MSDPSTCAPHRSPWDQSLARFIVRPLAKTHIHPNHLTVGTLVLGISSASLFAMGDPRYRGLAALLYMLAVFSDHMDGELARMSGKLSRFGHHFDYIVGGINYTLLFIGIGIGLYSTFGKGMLALGIAGGMANPFTLYLRITMENTFGKAAVEHPTFARFEIEDAIYLIGPITWFAGVLYFFIPFAAGSVGYLLWTLRQYYLWKHHGKA
jgi:archaetidylinositol phosphate synthase